MFGFQFLKRKNLITLKTSVKFSVDFIVVQPVNWQLGLKNFNLQLDKPFVVS